MKPIKLRLAVGGGFFTFSPTMKETLESIKDGIYDVIVKAQTKPRSLAKLRYFHGPALLAIAEDTGMIHPGMPPDEVAVAKEYLKEALKIKYRQFFPTHWKPDPFRKGKRITKRDGFTEISDEKCGEFLNALCLDFPCVPHPDTGNSMLFYQEMMERYPE